jgi:NAD(P)-dependent dehydrogenase (short-subunit alcohol dehydrogenase family)
MNSRVALVTGTSRGIGVAIAEGLAALGITVVATARALDAAEVTARRILDAGHAATPLALDVTDQSSVDAAINAVDARFGRLDILVNNAGAYFDRGHSAVDADLDLVQKALDANLIGSWRMCRAAIPLMRRHGWGRIVNMSSVASTFGRGPRVDTPAYSVAKAGLNMLTLKLGAELQGSGILVNAASPGWVRTEMGGPSATRSVEEGADTPIWLATLPDDGPTGGLFHDRQPLPW